MMAKLIKTMKAKPRNALKSKLSKTKKAKAKPRQSRLEMNTFPTDLSLSLSLQFLLSHQKFHACTVQHISLYNLAPVRKRPRPPLSQPLPPRLPLPTSSPPVIIDYIPLPMLSLELEAFLSF
jgi:hypothetical protein